MDNNIVSGMTPKQKLIIKTNQAIELYNKEFDTKHPFFDLEHSDWKSTKKQFFIDIFLNYSLARINKIQITSKESRIPMFVNNKLSENKD